MRKIREDEDLQELSELLQHSRVLQMKRYIQHGKMSCYDHCLHVAYISCKICRKLHLDYKAAARGGMLHDLFLYDWHTEKTSGGLHGFTHPKAALANAEKMFDLTKREKDIILRHMWPLTIIPPRYPESFIVLLVDKYCTIAEVLER